MFFILCAKHCAKFFIIMISFNISNNPIELVFFIPWYKKIKDVSSGYKPHLVSAASKGRGSDLNPDL